MNMNKWIYDRLCLRFPNFEGLTAIDLGCGEGFNAVGLAKLGVNVTAVDKQAAMIERTQELANKEKVAIITEVSKVQDFKPNTEYDIVLFTHVLHFIPSEDREKYIQKAINLVKTGGTIVFADLEDDLPVSAECLSILETSLKDIEIERFTIEDEPHLGANYLHQHKVFYLIGIKR